MTESLPPLVVRVDREELVYGGYLFGVGTSGTAPWESVLSVTTNKRMLVFTTAPGTLPAKMRNVARYGLPILTESPDTVRAAERALRTGVMPTVTARP
jgi:hypothetical protein